jgi:ribonucleoside-diphosphate reductase alpha chain
MPYAQRPRRATARLLRHHRRHPGPQHVDIQAAAQRWIDSSISKTINVPTDFPSTPSRTIYLYAYDQG